jgi:hypothetical protein
MTRAQKVQILAIRCNYDLQRMVNEAVDEILVLTEQVKILRQRKVAKRTKR